MDQQVLTICGIAFVAVFSLLTILAITQRIITWYLPEPDRKPASAPARDAPEAPPPDAAGQAADPAVVAVITNTLMNLYPNARVTRIEEKR